jgi:SnoaL-like polyketide cyclase
MTVIHTGDVPGLPPTGRSFRVVGAGVGEVRDGLIVHATEYFNMADLLTQVGILPPPAG